MRTVVVDLIPGTLLFSADDPDGDDNGPGNYAYPTSSNFQPGAYDLERFEVYDAGDSIVFRVRTRDLTPTFGSPLGAQLVDLYINTGGTPTSNAAAFAQRNYSVAAGWNKRIEVQGFGQQYQDAATPPNTLGQVTISANRITRYIAFSVSKDEPRHARGRLEVHGRADRAGRIQPRSGARLPADAGGVPIRRVRDGEQRSALHVRPRRGAEGGRRDRRAGTARLHARARVDRPGAVMRKLLIVGAAAHRGRRSGALSRAAAAPSNLSLGAVATASSSESAQYPGSNAIDGDPTTRWSSAFSDPQTLTVDLGARASISDISLLWEAAYGKAYTLEVSNDGSAWTQVAATDNSDGGTDDYPGPERHGSLRAADRHRAGAALRLLAVRDRGQRRVHRDRGRARGVHLLDAREGRHGDRAGAPEPVPRPIP